MHNSFAAVDFKAATLKRLAAKNIFVIGVQMLPDMASSMPYANATRGYSLDDNGTGRILTLLEVLALVA